MMGGEGILQQSNKNYCREHQRNLVLFFVEILTRHLTMGWNHIAYKTDRSGTIYSAALNNISFLLLGISFGILLVCIFAHHMKNPL